MAPGAESEPASPRLSAASAAAAAVRVGEPRFVNGRLHWVETPAGAGGEARLVSCAPGESPRRESAVGVSVRSRLYDYGAGSWCWTPLGAVVVESRTQLPLLVSPEQSVSLGGATPELAARIGDLEGIAGSTWLIAVFEATAPSASPRGLVAIDAATGVWVSLLAGDALFAEPVVSHDGMTVAWITWPLGSMPWDDAEVWVASLDLAGNRPALARPRRVDGGPGSSAGQPTWLPDGSLAYVTEAAGYWQPWIRDPGGVVRRLSDCRCEFQRPRWTTCRWLAPMTEGALACGFIDGGVEHVGALDVDGAMRVLDQPCVRVDGIASAGDLVGIVGATPTAQGVAVVAHHGRASAGAESVVLARTSAPDPQPTTAAHFSFVHDGVEVHGVVWPPIEDPTARPGGKPPLVVTVHPGPTGAVDVSYAPIVHLLTSHGFAVASVDYAGSTGHGRAHRERLYGRFGELDVDECVAAARHLVDVGRADGRATFLRGTSAGGTTALLALCDGALRGAVAWYPASSFVDDEAGAFECGYLDRLVGGRAEATTRSPLARVGQMAGSVLVIQGTDDPIVTPEGTRGLVDALRGSLGDVTYVEVAGEGHGFRTEQGRATAFQAELDFYLRCTLPGEDGDARYDAVTAPST